MTFLRQVLLNTIKALDAVASHLPSVGIFQPLKGSFSALDCLRDKTLVGEVLKEYQDKGLCLPESITQRCGLQQHDHQPWPVFWTMTEDARLVGKLLHWRNQADHICLESCHYDPFRRRLGEDRLLAQLVIPTTTCLSGAWTSLASYWSDGRNYFHWITDGLTRLCVREHLPEPTRVLIPQRAHRYVRESLEMLGIDEICESREEACLQPERFYFCSPTAMTGVWNPLGYNWLRESFRPFFLSAGSGKPIFLTRRASTRIPEQLAEIETIFSVAGYEILDCGKLGFRQQIEAASAASAIAGIHGAAMTNIIWAHPGTAVLELFQPHYLNACYEQIALQGHLDYSAHVLEGESPLRAIEEWLARQC